MHLTTLFSVLAAVTLPSMTYAALGKAPAQNAAAPPAPVCPAQGSPGKIWAYGITPRDDVHACDGKGGVPGLPKVLLGKDFYSRDRCGATKTMGFYEIYDEKAHPLASPDQDFKLYEVAVWGYCPDCAPNQVHVDNDLWQGIYADGDPKIGRTGVFLSFGNRDMWHA